MNNGKIVIADKLTCDVTLYNETLHNVTQELPGLYYGLIAYVCDNQKRGYLISKPKCFSCGVYCPQNDLLLTCSHFWFPFVMGSLIGIGSALACFYTLKYLRDKYYDRLLQRLHIKRTTQRERKLKKIKKFLLEDIESEKKEKGEGQKPFSRRASVTSFLYSALLASNHIREASACDRTLYVGSQNMICEQSTCKEANTFLISLENNMKVCFKSSEGKPFSISLTDYRAVVTYNYIYKTSSYELKTQEYSRCKGTNHCERGGPHEQGCRNTKFSKKLIIKPYTATDAT